MSGLVDTLRQIEQVLTVSQLVLAMLGMGVTLRGQDFWDILRRPIPILWILLLQFVAMPLLVAGLGVTGWLSSEILMGLILVMALPSGAQSNVFTYLGRGNVPLSITATCASTALGLVVTPLLLRVMTEWALPAGFSMPTGSVVSCILFQLLLPLLAGMWIGQRWPDKRQWLARRAVGTSFVMLGIVILTALGTGQLPVFHYGWKAFVSVIAVMALSSLLAKLATRLLGYSSRERYTMTIEVALRNAPLGIGLCGPLFLDGTERGEKLYGATMYVCLLAGGAMLGVCGVTITRRLREIARFSPT